MFFADQAPGLVKLSITRRRWIYFDAFLYLLQPYKLAFGFITLSLWFLWSAVGNPNFSLPAAAYVTFGTLYVFHLSQNHPFVDGNKRTALACALVFLELNDISVTDPEGRLYSAMMDVANGLMGKLDFASILRSLQRES